MTRGIQEKNVKIYIWWWEELFPKHQADVGTGIITKNNEVII